MTIIQIRSVMELQLQNINNLHLCFVSLVTILRNPQDSFCIDLFIPISVKLEKVL